MVLVEELYIKHYQSLCKYAFSLCRDAMQSHDLVQDAFTAAVQKGAPEEVSWLYTVIRHKAIDAKRKMRPELLEEAELLPDVSAFNLARPELGELRASIDDAVKDLPSKIRDAFVLYAQGVSESHIAEQLVIPMGTVRSRIFQARVKLQDMLKEFAPES